ncbi:type I polyketide synthase [Actinomadura macra]|uniref:type I polyketide synthase n=1 Tax=Actinomadura macra TaxID=46164 RepID=UPI000ACA4F08|nr:type I polyketide synthase [Actinomadura macra]
MPVGTLRTALAEPVAIIGMAGRFAGAPDVGSLWRLLNDGTDAIEEIPSDRYDIDAVFDPAPRTPGRTVSRWGGLIEDVKGFDAEFFGIAPREAERMDPQQRLLLEVAHEAIEDAGQRLDALAGSDTGVFVGQLGGDYWHMQYRHPERLDLYAMTGAASRAITSGRVSFAFDLRGPSVTVDTACSSSLVAVHQAMQALRLGECGLAIAAGVNVVLLPEEGVVYSGAGMLAKDGRCKFGDASGDGFVRSDGVGVVILKRLDQALADGDQIRAVLRGSAVGNDGRSSGYMVTPGVEGQRDVIQRAFRDADIDPAEADYVEAHGTGTSVGDPVELAALAEVLGAGRPADRPCLAGSIKTNLGHTEAAAGVASLIKTVLCLEKGVIPPSLHLRDPNPAVAWDELPLRIVTERTPMPERGRPAIAGISSFGFSGTNAHVVLTAPPVPQAAVPADDRTELLVLSATSPEALETLALRAADDLTSGPGRGRSLRDVCHSLATRRSRFESRLAVPVSSHEQAANALRAFAEGDDEPGLSSTDYADPEVRPRVAFVFPGQGSQWAGMGRELMATEPVFADTIAACSQAIQREAGWSLEELLRSGDEDQFTATPIVQPALWAMEIALAALWQSWGVEPDVVIGHSMGESAAAYVAGALDLADAAAVICRRSRLADRLAGQGLMAWAALSGAEAAAAIAGHEQSVAVAACNSVRSTVISGAADTVRTILDELDTREVFNRVVRVDFASHCPQVDAIREPLLQELADLAPRAGTVPLHSTLLNEEIDGSGMDAEYWVRNIREPVDFVGAVQAQLEHGDTVFVELSPHPLLINSIRETARALGADTTAVGSLRRDEPERENLLAAVGALHVAAGPVDFAALTPGGRFVPVPHHPWRHTAHWLPTDAEPARPPAPPVHPLLPTSSVAVTADGTHVWEGPFDLRRNAYLLDHRVQSTVILPGTAHVELMLAAARSVLGDASAGLADVRFDRALFLDEEGPEQIVQVSARPEQDGTLTCRVSSRSVDEDSWTVHSQAVAKGMDAPGDRTPEPFDLIKERCDRHHGRPDFYAWHAERGNQWEGAFQGVAEVWRTDGEALARLECPADLHGDLGAYEFHPAMLDACGHSLVAARPDVAAGQDQVFVLGGIDEVRVYGKPTEIVHSHARLVPSGDGASFGGHVKVFDRDGLLVAELRGARLQYLLGKAPEPVRETGSTAAETGPYQDWLYDLEFVETATPPAPVADPGTWLVFTDSGATGRRLIRRLRDQGAHPVAVTIAARFRAAGPDRFGIDPDRPEDFRELLAELSERGPVRGIVHLWSLDATASAEPARKEIDRAELLTCRSVVHLVQALDAHPLPGGPRLWLVTQDSQKVLPDDETRGVFQAPLWGLGRTAAAEDPTLRTVLADIDRDPSSVQALVTGMLSDSPEDQLALRGGHRYAARLTRHRTRGRQTARHITMDRPGVIDDLAEQPLRHARPGPGEVLIEVSHAALNYRDVLTAVGMYPGQSLTRPPGLGWECAGVISAVGPRVQGLAVGDEVVAIAEGALATEVLAKAALVAPKPRRLGPAEAVTLPAAYLTAYYALCHLGRIDAGDKVLIHTATGGVGLAALQIARWKRARAFGTASTAEKRRLLADLGMEATSDSRSLSFVDDFAGVGFDLVLNTLTGPAVAGNLSLLAPYGRYLEISKRDILEGNQVSLAPFARNLSLHAIDIVAMMAERPELTGRLLREVCALVDQGALDPLPHTVYPSARATEAFRLMSQARQIGKVVISFDQPAAVPAPASVDIGEDGVYLVTGGLGGIGAKVAGWLADQGARRLLLTGRSPVAEDHPTLTALRAQGAEVTYAALDVADLPAMKGLLSRHPDLRGVFHAAGTVDYAPLRDLGRDELSGLLKAKVRGSMNLDRLVGDGLDMFVLFSSGSALVGSPFLGGYAAGNAFQDALAHRRRARGAVATVVNWGFWDEVGMVARQQSQEGRSLVPQGMSGFTPEEGLDVLGRLLAENATQTAVLPADWDVWARAYPEAAGSPLLSTLIGRTPTPSGPRHQPQPPKKPADAATTRPAAAPPASQPVQAAPAMVVPPSTAPAIAAPEGPVPADPAEPVRHHAPQDKPAGDKPAPSVPPTATGSDFPAPARTGNENDAQVEDLFVERVAEVLGLKAERINIRRPLNKMGLDSLMAVELRNRLERDLGVKIPIVSILKGGSIASVAATIRDSQTQG